MKFSLCALLLSSGLFPLAAQVSAASQSPASAATIAHSEPCRITHRPPSDAEAALAREDYSAALDLFNKLSSTEPNQSRAGVIRAMLGQDKVAEARKLAEAWAAEQPANPNAIETLGEAQLRDGEPILASHTIEQAGRLDPCNPRTSLMIGEIEELAGLFASGKARIELAYGLDPQDPEIRSAWISTLPRSQRIAEREAYAGDSRLVSEKQRKDLLKEVAYSKQHQPGECSVTQPAEHAVIPIRPIQDGPRVAGLALDLSFSGKRRRLEIDTGASGIVLSRGAATGLGLVREVSVQSGGVGDKGEVETSIAHAPLIKIGDLEFYNCAVEIIEKRSALDIDGLIGGDVFRKYVVTIDYPKAQLRLDPLPPRPSPASQVRSDAQPAGGALKPSAAQATETRTEVEEDPWQNRYIAPEMHNWTRIWRDGHEMFIPVSIGGTKERLFLIDTGAGLMSISPAAAKEVTKVRRDAEAGVRGISGEVDKVYYTGGFDFRFANLHQKVESMTAFDTTKLSHDAGLEISGFLGAPILQRLAIHIDYRDNLVLFEYDPANDSKFRVYQ